MRLTIMTAVLTMVLLACQPKVDNSATEAFKKNSATVLTYLEGYQNENLDYSIFAEDFISRSTWFGSESDSVTLAEMMEGDQKTWAKYDLELTDEPMLLPGVSTETKLPDGSVRFYGDWKITLSATDSTEAKSGILKGYESFDFDADGKILYEQFYGDLSGLFYFLNKKDETMD